MVQALRGEISVCSSNQNTPSTNTKVHICIIDTDYRDKLMKQTEYSLLPEKTEAEKNQFTNYQNKLTKDE